MTTIECAGATLWYESMGQGDELLALHGGLGLDHTYLRPWLDPLAEAMRLTFLDFRANGRSTGAGDGLTMQRLADDVDALREHLGAERMWLLGHSYGGFVALQYALSYPEHVNGLVLCDTDSTAPSGEIMMRELDRLGAGPEVMAAFAAPMETTEDLHRFFEATGPYYFPHSQAPTWATAFERLIFSADGGRGGDLALEGWDVSERIAEIGAPALVVTGADDFLFPPERAQALHERIADSTLAVVERSGHLPFIEQRDSFLELVRTFTGRS